MDPDSPWESMRAEQENGELLSVDEKEEAAKGNREDDKTNEKEVWISLDSRNEKCGDRFLKCLSHVPCASLIAWIILLVGLGGLTGGLLIGVRKTREMLSIDQFLWFMEYTLIGVVVGMFLIGTGLLCLGHVSSEPTSRHLFHTSSKNFCAQGLNICMLIFCYILGFAWIVTTAVLAVPVYLLFLLFILPESVTCINLVNYGLSEMDKEFCDLADFKREGGNLIISYIAALVSSILIAVSLIHFMIIISANLAHLRESRLATLNAYDDDAVNSKLVADTTM